MAHLEGILEGQKSLEEKVNKKMEELQQQLLNAGPHKDTVAKVAEEFRTFRELIFNMIGLLRNQIEECVKHIELFENRHRQKALVFMGIPEVEKESCSKSVLQVIHSKLNLESISTSSIRSCHRLGAQDSEGMKSEFAKLEKVHEDLVEIQNSILSLWLDSEEKSDEIIEADLETVDNYDSDYYALQLRVAALNRNREHNDEFSSEDKQDMLSAAS
ncbi:hypothetical protein ACJJTC_017861, partial [Scirpophaga incertulas]